MSFDTLPRSRKARNSRGNSDIDAALHALLTELASIFVPRGVTPKQFGEFAKRAFVWAAANISQFRTGRVNQSRVAVLTGLSRAQVRGLLVNPYSSEPHARPSRIERVIHGWRTDSRFCDERGPKRLTTAGTRPSFPRLIKIHGGDVPHRAVLDELCRIGAVRSSGGFVALTPSGRYREKRAIHGLSMALPVALDGLRSMSRELRSRDGSSVHRLILTADDPLDLIRIRDRCTLSAEAMLKGLRESLGVQVTTPRVMSGRGSCTVTVLVVDSPSRSDHRYRTESSPRHEKRSVRTPNSHATHARRSK
jgi:hypothetical protein